MFRWGKYLSKLPCWAWSACLQSLFWPQSIGMLNHSMGLARSTLTSLHNIPSQSLLLWTTWNSAIQNKRMPVRRHGPFYAMIVTSILSSQSGLFRKYFAFFHQPQQISLSLCHNCLTPPQRLYFCWMGSRICHNLVVLPWWLNPIWILKRTKRKILLHLVNN